MNKLNNNWPKKKVLEEVERAFDAGYAEGVSDTQKTSNKAKLRPNWATNTVSKKQRVIYFEKTKVGEIEKCEKCGNYYRVGRWY